MRNCGAEDTIKSWMDKNDSSSTFLNCITEAKLCCANLKELVVKKYSKMGLDKHGGACSGL
jgi:hypothetical protein